MLETVVLNRGKGEGQIRICPKNSQDIPMGVGRE